MYKIQFTLDGRYDQNHAHVWQKSDAVMKVKNIDIEVNYCECGLYEAFFPNDLMVDLGLLQAPISYGHKVENK